MAFEGPCGYCGREFRDEKHREPNWSDSRWMSPDGRLLAVHPWQEPAQEVSNG